MLARAVVVTIFHGGFAAWGSLMWAVISDACDTVLRSQYQVMWTFQHIAVVHNAVLCAFMIIHEAFLAKQLGSDFTLMSEIKPGAYRSSSYMPVPTSGTGNSPSSTMPGMMSAGIAGEAQPMSPDIAKDYENIIKSPPGQLAQTQP